MFGVFLHVLREWSLGKEPWGFCFAPRKTKDKKEWGRARNHPHMGASYRSHVCQYESPLPNLPTGLLPHAQPAHKTPKTKAHVHCIVGIHTLSKNEIPEHYSWITQTLRHICFFCQIGFFGCGRGKGKTQQLASVFFSVLQIHRYARGIKSGYTFRTTKKKSNFQTSRLDGSTNFSVIFITQKNPSSRQPDRTSRSFRQSVACQSKLRGWPVARKSVWLYFMEQTAAAVKDFNGPGCCNPCFCRICISFCKRQRDRRS